MRKARLFLFYHTARLLTITSFARTPGLTVSARRPCYHGPMNVIYADVLFALSVFTDYLLCLVTARFCALRLRRGRYLLAAVFGGVYAVAVFLPGLSWLAHPLVELCAAGVMGLISFGGEERLFRCVAAFLAVSASFGGAAWAVALRQGSLPAPDLRLLAAVFVGSYLLLSLLSLTRQRRARQHRAEVTLTLGGRRAGFTALEDSGNCLRDSLTGRSVLLVSPGALRPLFPGQEAILELEDAVELVTLAAALPELRGRFRLLSCRSVGGDALLAAFRPDAAEVDGKARDDLLAAVSKEAAGDGFQGVV